MSNLRILYLANHTAGMADDEGAIAYALRQLGHTVECVHEERAKSAFKVKADLCLFHKLDDITALDRLDMPRVGWYFDLVEWPDDTLELRCRGRRNWMAQVLPRCDLMFCTDGNWVEEGAMKSLGNCSLTTKLVWLPQGADERIVGNGTPKSSLRYPLLFTGIRRGGGRGRIDWVDWMTERYGDDFHAISHGVYRETLRDAIAASAIVVCPDSPATNRYWSNRVYNALGFEACVFHPYCEGLARQYRGNEDLVFYRNREELENAISNYLQSPILRNFLAQNGLRTTVEKHLYRHRCQQLLTVVRDQLGVG